MYQLLPISGINIALGFFLLQLKESSLEHREEVGNIFQGLMAEDWTAGPASREQSPGPGSLFHFSPARGPQASHLSSRTLIPTRQGLELAALLALGPGEAGHTVPIDKATVSSPDLWVSLGRRQANDSPSWPALQCPLPLILASSSSWQPPSSKGLRPDLLCLLIAGP